jgi:hypothetical protein
MQVGDYLGGKLLGRVRYVEVQSVVRLFEVGELASENGFACEVAVTGFDVLAHDVVSSPEIDDVHVKSCGKFVAVRLL